MNNNENKQPEQAESLDVQYDDCPFCGKKKFGSIKHGTFGDREVTWFSCFDCSRVYYYGRLEHD